MQIVGVVVLLIIALYLVKIAIGIAMITLKLALYAGVALVLGYGGWFVYRQTLDQPTSEKELPGSTDINDGASE